MKIFGYEFRKFEQSTTTIEVIETWIVKWESIHRDCIDNGKPNIELQSFITKKDANFFAGELISARKLMGDRGYNVKVYKQNSPTNK